MKKIFEILFNTENRSQVKIHTLKDVILKAGVCVCVCFITSTNNFPVSVDNYLS